MDHCSHKEICTHGVTSLHMQKNDHVKRQQEWKGEASEEINPAHALVLDFQTPKCEKINLFWLSHLVYGINMAAGAN